MTETSALETDAPATGERRDTGRIVIDALFSEYPFPDFLGPIRRRAAEFERAHPQYRVNVAGCDYEQLPAEVSRRSLAGRPPTIASYYSGATQQARDTVTADGRPLFTSVERELAGRTEILGEPVVLDDLIPAARGFFTTGGELVSVPLTLSTMLLYTNTSVLRAAGVADIPRTWSEVDAACRAVAALPAGPRHRVVWPVDGKLFQQWVAQQGGVLVNNAGGHEGRATEVDLLCPQLMSFVDWWHRLNLDGHFCYTGTLEDWPGTFAAFAEQQVVFRVGSSFDADYMMKAGREGGFDVAVSLLPHNDAHPPVGNWIGGDSIWLAGGLDPAARDGALAFIQYLGTARHAAEWHTASGSTPTTVPSIELLERDGWFDANPYHRVATEQLRRTDGSPGSHAPVFAGSNGIQQAIMRAMEDVLVRGADPLARFTRANAEAQQAVDDYNATCLGPGPRDPSWLVVGT